MELELEPELNYSTKFRNLPITRSKIVATPFIHFLSICFPIILIRIPSQVLVAAGISAAIGQLSKPFTSVLLYGKDLDFKAAFQAGGFPSTHSSVLSALYSTLIIFGYIINIYIYIYIAGL